jgi:hypothetical protein
LAAATLGVSVRRKLIYRLIWQSVMWRPGKLRFLTSVENPLPIDRPRPPENTAPCGDPRVARFATPVGLRPPSVTHPAILPHPDRRALLIPFAAQHDDQLIQKFDDVKGVSSRSPVERQGVDPCSCPPRDLNPDARREHRGPKRVGQTLATPTSPPLR